MRKVILVFFCAAIIAGPLMAKETAKGSSFFDSFGLVFTMQNLLLDIDNFEDGYQNGAGATYWLSDRWAARGLFMVHHQSNSELETSETWLGLSGLAAYHFAGRALSPYIGPLAGVRFRMEQENSVDFYFGGAIGGEMQVFKNVSAFAEYTVIAAFDDEGFGVDFGAENSANLGIILYFK